MVEQQKSMKQNQQRIWISQDKKEVFFSEIREYERMEFRRYEEMIQYIRACVESGYKIG